MKKAPSVLFTAPRLVGAVLLAFPLALLGCHSKVATDTVAEINGSPVRYIQFEGFLRDSLGELGVGLESEVLTALFDQFMTEELLRTLAIEQGVVQDGSDRRAAAAGLMAGAFSDSLTDTEVAVYYETYPEQFVRPERVHLRQILVEERSTAEKVKVELAGGQDFAELARRWSRDPSADLGGDQGQLARDDLPATFVEAIFSLEDGQVSDIMPAEYGFHIFQVVEMLPRQVVPLSEAEDQIRQILQTQLADQLLADMVKKCREQYDVEVYEENLPFDYDGSYQTVEN